MKTKQWMIGLGSLLALSLAGNFALSSSHGGGVQLNQNSGNGFEILNTTESDAHQGGGSTVAESPHGGDGQWV